jgi:hypothetical protein
MESPFIRKQCFKNNIGEYTPSEEKRIFSTHLRFGCINLQVACRKQCPRG